MTKMRALLFVALAATACDPVDVTDEDLRAACSEYGSEDRLVVPQDMNGWVGYLDDRGQPVAALRIIDGIARCYSYTHGWDHRDLEIPPMVVVDRRDDHVLLYGVDFVFGCFAGNKANMTKAEFSTRNEAPVVKTPGPVISNVW